MDSYRQVLLCVILIHLHVGHTLRSACSEDLRKCTSIQRIPGDFQAAQDECVAKGGSLMKGLSKYSNETIAALVNNTFGNFWIGELREGKCLTPNSEVDSQVLLQRDDEVGCSPNCISVSSNGMWYERPCDDSLDGFLCDNVRWDSWPLDETSKVVIVAQKDCSSGPCENSCEKVLSGYMCSCFEDFRPSKKDPRHCEFYCKSHTCLPKCYLIACDCPEGFVKDEGNCTDIDECKPNHNCAQTCINTIGSYTCSCDEGFLLVDGSKCIPRISSSPKQEVDESSEFSHVSTATSGEYVGLSVFLVVALILLIVLIYYLRKRRSAQSDGIVNDTDA